MRCATEAETEACSATKHVQPPIVPETDLSGRGRDTAERYRGAGGARGVGQGTGGLEPDFANGFHLKSVSRYCLACLFETGNGIAVPTLIGSWRGSHAAPGRAEPVCASLGASTVPGGGGGRGGG